MLGGPTGKKGGGRGPERRSCAANVNSGGELHLGKKRQKLLEDGWMG